MMRRWSLTSVLALGAGSDCTEELSNGTRAASSSRMSWRRSRPTRRQFQTNVMGTALDRVSSEHHGVSFSLSHVCAYSDQVTELFRSKTMLSRN